MRKTVALGLVLCAAGLVHCQRVDGLQSVSFRGESALVSNAVAVAVDRGAALARDGLALAKLRRAAREIDGSPLVAKTVLSRVHLNETHRPERERDLDAEREEPEEEPVIVSIARETWIQAAPRWSSSKLGYLRAGTIVKRHREPEGHRRCKGGWYRIKPKGYVCVGLSATTDRTHPVAQLSTRKAKRDGLPFDYVATRYPTPPLYVRLPTLEQQKEHEPKREYHLRRHRKLMRDPKFVPLPKVDEQPPGLADNALVPGLGATRRGRRQIIDGHAGMRSAFALLGSYDHMGRRFGLTTDLHVIPLDRTRRVAQSKFRGAKLGKGMTLPIAFVMRRSARRYSWHAPSRSFSIDARLPRWTTVSLTGDFRRGKNDRYLKTRAGFWVRASHVKQVRGIKEMPRWAKRGDKWMDVSIVDQSLVAYQGTKPLFATLVSTGKDGLEDPEETHATIQGTFLVHTKHVSVTMDGDEEGDEFDLRDVPFVQYFKGGYALHAAHWHEDFGRPRSHGCVNLSPLDASWLFGFTDPPVPGGWHAALSLRKGTLVRIRP